MSRIHSNWRVRNTPPGSITHDRKIYSAALYEKLYPKVKQCNDKKENKNALPGVDSELLVRMLLIGYLFDQRERKLFVEVKMYNYLFTLLLGMVIMCLNNNGKDNPQLNNVNELETQQSLSNLSSNETHNHMVTHSEFHQSHVIIADKEGAVLFSNLKETTAEIKNNSIENIFTYESAALIRKALYRVFETGSTSVFEIEGINTAVTSILTKCTVSPIKYKVKLLQPSYKSMRAMIIHTLKLFGLIVKSDGFVKSAIIKWIIRESHS